MRYSGKDIDRCTSVIHRAVRTLFVPLGEVLPKKKLRKFTSHEILTFSSFGNEEKVAADPRVRPLA